MVEAAAVSIFAAVTVFIVIAITAWLEFRQAEAAFPRRRATRYSLSDLDSWLQDRKKRNEKSVETLRVSETDFSPNRFPNKNDRFVDAWGHELCYELNEDGSFTLYSLGRDNKHGGEGLDADLFADGRDQNRWRPSFNEFYFPDDANEIQKGDLIEGAALTAMSVLVAVFFSLRTSTAKFQRSLFSINSLARVIGLVLLALAIGVTLAPLHIPNGH